ncbi:MAG: BamA/TamA family outer membrane protein [Planctomycetaceae bacterium]|nr:BamA/TamA family outer membrane protein [Planctomycetaceae bacterium]
MPVRLLALTGVAAAIACLLPSGRGQESPASFSSVADRLPGVGATSSATPPPAQLTPAEELVAEVRIVGNETTTTTQIITNITTRAGRPFDETVVQRDVRNLANLGWFVDVKSLYERTPQGRIVIFQVVERPTIRYVQYVGNTKIKDKTLSKQTLLKVGGSVDPYAVQEGKRKLRDYYVSKGFNNVQISILEGDKPTDQGVTYLIHEGFAQKIWKTKFVGNDSGFVSDSRLKTLIKSKPPILYMFKGFLDRDKIDADIAAITDYYRAHGYFQARVSREIDPGDEGDWSTLTFVIHEGIQSKVRNVTVLGNTKFEQKPLEEKLTLTNGLPFEQAKMQKDAQWLQELYGSQGYVFADVQPETIYLEEPGQVDLRYDIKEGDRFRVGRIFVHINGDNPHTRIQTALNRVTLRPGQIMDIRELKASERRLLASSLFHTDAQSGQRPKISYRIPDDAEIGMAERPTGNVRGQSPDVFGPPVLPPLGSNVSLSARPIVLDNPVAPLQQGDMEVHYYCDDEEHFRRWQAAEALPDAAAQQSTPAVAVPVESGENPTGIPTAPIEPPTTLQRPIFRGQSPEAPAQLPYWAPQRSSAPHVVHRPPGEGETTATEPYGTAPAPNDPYGNVRAVRGQSPANQAYSTLPAGGTPAMAYGGQVIPVTPPAEATVSGVTPAQYSGNLQPPAGSVAPQPLTPLGPLPGFSVDPQLPMSLDPNVPAFSEQMVDIYVDGTETQTGRLMIGFGVNSDAGVVGNVVVDERNFDWTRIPTSWEDVRSGAALRGAGQRFRIDASPGSSVNRYLVSFQEPYLFDRPISLGLSGSYFDRNYADWDEQRVGGRISLGHQWVERDLSATLAYRGENVKIFNPSVPEGVVPLLDEALGSNVLHGFRVSLINDTRDSSFLATQGHYFEVGGEQVIGTFDYPRVDIDFRQYWMLRERPDHSGRHVLSLSTTVGYTGTHTPIYENFFAGGFATLRGFDFRGASPMQNGVEVGGRFQWLNSLQYLFPVSADDMLHGVAFCDFGTVEPGTKIQNFRVAPGIGARITVPAMGPAPIALDFAFPVSYAATDDREVFSFSMGFSR